MNLWTATREEIEKNTNITSLNPLKFEYNNIRYGIHHNTLGKVTYAIAINTEDVFIQYSFYASKPLFYSRLNCCTLFERFLEEEVPDYIPLSTTHRVYNNLMGGYNTFQEVMTQNGLAYLDLGGNWGTTSEAVEVFPPFLPKL